MIEAEAPLPRRLYFRFAAFLSLCAAIYHALAIFTPSLDLTGDPLRHGVFILVGLAGVPLLLARPPWVVLAFSALTVQQIMSHGLRATRWWLEQGRVDWQSLLVLVIMPMTLVVLVLDWRARTPPKPRRRNRPANCQARDPSLLDGRDVSS